MVQGFKVDQKSKPCITNIALYDVNTHAWLTNLGSCDFIKRFPAYGKDQKKTNNPEP